MKARNRDFPRVAVIVGVGLSAIVALSFPRLYRYFSESPDSVQRIVIWVAVLTACLIASIKVFATIRTRNTDVNPNGFTFWGSLLGAALPLSSAIVLILLVFGASQTILMLIFGSGFVCTAIGLVLSQVGRRGL